MSAGEGTEFCQIIAMTFSNGPNHFAILAQQ